MVLEPPEGEVFTEPVPGTQVVLFSNGVVPYDPYAG